MTLGPELTAAIEALGEVMAGAREGWWIIGSAAVALHGVDPGGVADVDVLLSLADARRILPAVGLGLQAGPAHPAFRSGLFGRWTDTALPVEFMADFRHLAGQRWVEVRPATRQAIAVARALVFVPERAELQAMLASFGRPRDRERARRLADAV